MLIMGTIARVADEMAGRSGYFATKSLNVPCLKLVRGECDNAGFLRTLMALPKTELSSREGAFDWPKAPLRLAIHDLRCSMRQRC